MFVIAYVREYDRGNGQLLDEGPVETAVHGDANGFVGRVPAGSASDVGGLRTGDAYPHSQPWRRTGPLTAKSFPLLVWEGSLTDDREAVVMSPTIWDWNRPARDQDYWLRDMRASSVGAWNTVKVALANSAGWTGPSMAPLGGIYPYSSISSWSGSHTRPIGGTDPCCQNSVIIQHLGLVVTRELIERALNSPAQIGGFGPGIIQVQWREGSSNGGNYLLYLQVERVQ